VLVVTRTHKNALQLGVGLGYHERLPANESLGDQRWEQ
jgi:hypothetical protein